MNMSLHVTTIIFYERNKAPLRSYCGEQYLDKSWHESKIQEKLIFSKEH